MADDTLDLLRGTLDLLILRALSWQASHGYGIARWIQQVTDDVLRVEEGSLYPSLYRMEDKGWVKAEWGVSENNRRAKYYRLTAAGRKQLAEQAVTWSDFSTAVGKIMSAS